MVSSLRWRSLRKRLSNHEGGAHGPCRTSTRPSRDPTKQKTHASLTPVSEAALICAIQKTYFFHPASTAVAAASSSASVHFRPLISDFSR